MKVFNRLTVFLATSLLAGNLMLVEAKGAPGSLPASKVEKSAALGEAIILQNTLRISLNQPTSISLYNSRGQLVFQKDTQAQIEDIPLQGMLSGFLYLTLRSGSLEVSRKFLYTGK